MDFSKQSAAGQEGLDISRMALLVVDMQSFSCAAQEAKELADIECVVTNINKLAEICRQKGVPVIWICHRIESEKDGGLYVRFHGQEKTLRLIAGSKHIELYSKMKFDTSRDHLVYKKRYSAFLPYPSALQEKLSSLGRSQLLITGVAANVCVESTLRDAMQLDYEVFLLRDCTTTFDPALGKATEFNTECFFGTVCSLREISKALESALPADISDSRRVGIHNDSDIDAFFTAYNNRDFDTLFDLYMAEDCFWYASEKPLSGKKDILDYWIHHHSAFKETLLPAEKVVFHENMVYLQCRIRLDFIDDGCFNGLQFKKGDSFVFGDVDYYELDEFRRIKRGLVYVKFFNQEAGDND